MKAATFTQARGNSIPITIHVAIVQRAGALLSFVGAIRILDSYQLLRQIDAASFRQTRTCSASPSCLPLPLLLAVNGFIVRNLPDLGARLYQAHHFARACK